jgi:hypothetical protein
MRPQIRSSPAWIAHWLPMLVALPPMQPAQPESMAMSTRGVSRTCGNRITGSTGLDVEPAP